MAINTMATGAPLQRRGPAQPLTGIKSGAEIRAQQSRGGRPASTQITPTATNPLAGILNAAGLGGTGTAAAGAGGGTATGGTGAGGGTVPNFTVPATTIQTSGNPTTQAAESQLKDLSAKIAAQQGTIDPTLQAQMAKYAELYGADSTRRLMDQAASAQRDLAAGMGAQGDIRGAMTGTGPGTGARSIGEAVARNTAGANAQIAKDELARKAGILSASNALALTPTQTGLANQAQLADLAKSLGGLGIEQGNLALGQGKLGLDAQTAAMDAYLKKYGIDVGAQTANTGNILDLYRALYGMAL